MLKLNDESLNNLMKQANLFRENNCYFYGLSTNKPSHFLLGGFISLANKYGGYVFNYTGDGLGIVPIDSISGNAVIKDSCFLTLDKIKEVNTKKSINPFVYKLVNIINYDNQCISVKIVGRYKNNLDKFLQLFSK